MKKIIWFLILFFLLNGCGTNKNIPQPKDNNMLKNKNILIVVAPKDFRDQEYSDAKAIFSAAGIKTAVASIQTGTAVGIEGTEVMIDMVVGQVKVNKFDAVVFIGGAGMLEIVNDESLQILAKKFYQAEKITAAICAAPGILAQTGILDGKNATSWSGLRNTLEKNGAYFVSQPVVVDGKIITADGPEATKKFAEEIIKALP